MRILVVVHILHAHRGVIDQGRRAIRIRGIVQGVGFRPAMYRLAGTLGLSGFVRNDREGVWLEIEGPTTDLESFLSRLSQAAPSASRIDSIEVASIAARRDGSFVIAESPVTHEPTRGTAAIPADLAPCSDCLRELAEPTNRRYRYPFINCTACGPRFSIVREVPYDRGKTTMGEFVLCELCRREYEDPSDRRFHAEPNACPACGPRVQLVADGEVVAMGDTAMHAAAAALSEGAIVAVKGVGGFVLAVDARSESAVARLRVRKRRPDKPFAVMARSIEAVESVALLDDAACALLRSPMRPIVLVPSRGPLAPSVAPGLDDIGIYLPATPLQYLLLEDGPALQVMTSGNVAEEPIARTNDDAFVRLAEVADVFLIHDREVYSRVDDSVIRWTADRPIPMRRSRGFVPDTFALPVSGSAILAVGGHERNTVCLAAEGRAVLSQHVGDLDHPLAVEFFAEVIDHLQRLVGAKPELVAHDLHPDYASTRWALASGLPCTAVQHHHAHVAACLAELGRTDRVIALAYDGTGLGDDGTLWGGEVLECDLATSRRRGHLRAIALPGGEAAITQPWRLAAAALIDAGEPLAVLDHVAQLDRDRVGALLATALPQRATGAGRWFDAVAGLLGITRTTSYDGQAAIELEAIASGVDARPFEYAITGDDPFEIDLRPTIRELASEVRRNTSRATLAARFHATLATASRAACARIGARTVVLTGGCFQNRRLLAGVTAALEADGIEVLRHRRVPPNDGGLALGQAAVAAARSSRCV